MHQPGKARHPSPVGHEPRAFGSKPPTIPGRRSCFGRRKLEQDARRRWSIDLGGSNFEGTTP